MFVLLLPGTSAWRFVYMDGAAAVALPMPNHTIGAWCELGAAETMARQTGFPREFLIVGETPERTVFAVDLPHYATDAAALAKLRGCAGEVTHNRIN